ncbi:HIT family protein [Cryobacterium sp. AP23]
MLEPPTESNQACPLCRASGGQIVWSDDKWLVVSVEDRDFPAYYRVIARSHVAEFSEIQASERGRCMELVAAVESVLIQRLKPSKVNIASLGNLVPHLHWHVIARFDWDSHFPESIWGTKQRLVDPAALRCIEAELDELNSAIFDALTER